MAKGFKKGAGGANPLNFKVVGSLTEPANPKENMIWVNTDQKITAWTFSADEPTEPVEGMVWFKTTFASALTVNLLKKNRIQVSLSLVCQYVSGAFVEKETLIYRDGKWEGFYLYLYNYGKLGYTWTTVQKKPYDGDGLGYGKPVESTTSTGALKFTQTTDGNAGGMAYMNEAVDLSGYNTLEFDGVLYGTHTDAAHVYFGIYTAIGSYTGDNCVASIRANMSGTATVDISQLDKSKKYYIGFSIFKKNSYVQINYIKLR